MSGFVRLAKSRRANRQPERGRAPLEDLPVAWRA